MIWYKKVDVIKISKSGMLICEDDDLFYEEFVWYVIYQNHVFRRHGPKMEEFFRKFVK